MQELNEDTEVSVEPEAAEIEIENVDGDGKQDVTDHVGDV